jgi:hypothetical protein
MGKTSSASDGMPSDALDVNHFSLTEASTGTPRSLDHNFYLKRSCIPRSV